MSFLASGPSEIIRAVCRAACTVTWTGTCEWGERFLHTQSFETDMPRPSARNRTKHLKPGCQDALWTDVCVCAWPSHSNAGGSALLGYFGTPVALLLHLPHKATLPGTVQQMRRGQEVVPGTCSWPGPAHTPALPLSGTHSQGHGSAAGEAGTRSLVVCPGERRDGFADLPAISATHPESTWGVWGPKLRKRNRRKEQTGETRRIRNNMAPRGGLHRRPLSGWRERHAGVG